MNLFHALALTTFSAACVLACSGGGGASGDPSLGYDTPPTSGEFPRTTGDVPKISTDLAPGQTTGGGLCPSTYKCVTVSGGKQKTDTLSLTPGPKGTCTGGGTSFNVDGTITVVGQTIGKWQTSGDGITGVVADTKSTSSFVCVRTSNTATGTSTPPPEDDLPSPPKDAGTKDAK